MFSEGAPVTACAFTYDTVQSPVLANGIGIYGGTGNRAEYDVIQDTVSASAGIAISTRFNPVAFAGTTSVQHDTLTRTGGLEPNWPANLGALWIFADQIDIAAPIVVHDLSIADSTWQGLLVSFQRNIDGLSLDGVTIAGAGTYGMEINATGAATFSNTHVSGAASGGLSLAPTFTLTRGPGDTGF